MFSTHIEVYEKYVRQNKNKNIGLHKQAIIPLSCDETILSLLFEL